jgi:NADPH2:quinone reductase
VRALTIVEKALVVEERDTPVPGPNDVLIEVHAAGINAADLLQRQGHYPAPSGWPKDVPGMEFAGVVAAVGDGAAESLLGRRVAAIVGGGAQSTHCLAPAEHLLFVPDHATWEAAGGFPEAFETAYDALVTQGKLVSGERVLISGSAGGVGMAGVQIAHVLGAHVIAVTRNDEHHERLRSLGADQVVTLEEVGDLDGVDVVLELLGAVHLNVAQRVLNPYARVVVIGVGGGGRAEIDLLGLMRRRALITGSTLRSRSREEKAEVAAHVAEDLVPRWAEQKLDVPLARVFSLDEAEAAYEYFATPGKFGKVVLRVSE